MPNDTPGKYTLDQLIKDRIEEQEEEEEEKEVVLSPLHACGSSVLIACMRQFCLDCMHAVVLSPLHAYGSSVLIACMRQFSS